jgi:hypothetical protein
MVFASVKPLLLVRLKPRWSQWNRIAESLLKKERQHLLECKVLHFRFVFSCSFFGVTDLVVVLVRSLAVETSALD